MADGSGGGVPRTGDGAPLPAAEAGALRAVPDTAARKALDAVREFPAFLETYDVVRRIGSGSFATVFECKRKDDGTRFALKVLDLRYRRLASARDRTDVNARREAEILSRVRHPNVVNLYDHFESSKARLLVEELVEGGELLDKLLERSLTEDEVRHVAPQLLSAVAYLHSIGVLHRDIKAENVLFQPRGKADGVEGDLGIVKLVDFGLSKQPQLHSMARTLVGTPQYFAPEILMQKAGFVDGYGVESDCWALGVLLYLMLTARFPFPSSSRPHEPTAEHYILSGSFAQDDRWQRLSPEARDLVSGFLTVRPSERLTAGQALLHPFFCKAPLSYAPSASFRRGSKSFANAVATLPTGGMHMWLDSDGRITAMDERLLSTIRWPLSTAVGTKLEDLVVPEQAEMMKSLRAASLLTGSLREVPVHLRLASGTGDIDGGKYVEASLSGLVFRGVGGEHTCAGFVIMVVLHNGSLFEVSASVSGSPRSESPTPSSAASLAIAVTLDPKRRVVSYTPDLAKVMGCPDADFLGQKFETWVHRDCLDRVQDTLVAVAERGSACTEAVLRRPDGTLFASFLNCTSEVDSEGSLRRVMVVCEYLGDREKLTSSRPSRAGLDMELVAEKRQCDCSSQSSETCDPPAKRSRREGS